MTCMSWTEPDSGYRCMLAKGGPDSIRAWACYVGFPPGVGEAVRDSWARGEHDEDIAFQEIVGAHGVLEATPRVWAKFLTNKPRKEAIELCERLARYLSWRQEFA